MNATLYSLASLSPSSLRTALSLPQSALLPARREIHFVNEETPHTHLTTLSRRRPGRTPGFRSAKLLYCRSWSCWSRRRATIALEKSIVKLQLDSAFRGYRERPCSTRGSRSGSAPVPLCPIFATSPWSGPPLLLCSGKKELEGLRRKGGDEQCTLTLKSIPTVEIKLPERKRPSRNCIKMQVLPTPESPNSMTWGDKCQWRNRVGGRYESRLTTECQRKI
jgi:hypothetical protein